MLPRPQIDFRCGLEDIPGLPGEESRIARAKAEEGNVGHKFFRRAFRSVKRETKNTAEPNSAVLYAKIGFWS